MEIDKIINELAGRVLNHYEKQTGLNGVSSLIMPMVDEQAQRIANCGLDHGMIRTGLGLINVISNYGKPTIVDVTPKPTINVVDPKP